MAKYIVTSGSYYRPFSYDEIVKPLQQQTDMQNAMADAYDQLNLETSALKNYISDNPDDRQAKQMYEGYLNKLSTFQNDLYNNGLTASTRRNMSAARSAYASDITRLQKAVQTRQERSKAYWDARHKNPDLVAGFDPGASGLDNYLGDDNYGQNWYSYSGNQFASEVGAEAKARAAELKETAVQRNPQLAGYLEYVEKNGFSNAEVNAAGALAQQMLAGNIRPDDPTIDPVQGMLAGVLISRLQATGANPGQNISPEEFGRLFNYGMLGLSQGVGNRESKLVSDKIWEEQMARNRYAWQHSLTSPKDTPAENSNPQIQTVRVEAQDAQRNRKKLHNWFDDDFYADGPRTINLPDGGSVMVSSPDDARKLFHTEAIDNFYKATGVDLRTRASDWTNTTASKKQGRYRGVPIVLQETGGLFGGRGRIKVKKKVKNQWIDAPELTEMANRAKKDYEVTMDAFRRANPGLNISSIGATPEEEKKVYDKIGIPEGVPPEDLRVAAESKLGVRDIPVLSLVHGKNETERKFNKNTLISGIERKYAEEHGKRDWKNSDWGFYKVGAGNDAVGNKNAARKKEGGLDNVFVTKNGRIDPDSVIDFQILPTGIKDGKVKVRVLTTNGIFETDSSVLGGNVDEEMKRVRELRDQNGNLLSTYTMTDLLDVLMTPLSQPVEVLDRNNPVGMAWENVARTYLRQPPLSRAGGLHVATAAEVVRDEDMQKELMNGIQELLYNTIF